MKIIIKQTDKLNTPKNQRQLHSLLLQNNARPTPNNEHNKKVASNALK